MNLKEEILTRLYAGETSGEQLAIELGVTRAAVWKCVRQLKKDGFVIDAVTNRGYRLLPSDVINAPGIKHKLHSEWTVETLSETDSTNNVAKARAAAGANRHAVVADRQTAGRGRLARAFFSPGKAGVYLSAVVRPQLLGVNDCGRITAYAAVATARAVAKLSGADVKIKWVNDLFLNGRKICGILTEGGVGLEGGTLDYAVVGIGVNARAVDFPDELRSVATTVEAETGVKVDRCELAAEILDNLARLEDEIAAGAFLDEYRARSCVVGRRVTVNGEYEADAVGIDDDCALLLDRNGERIGFSAGEVSVKIK